MGVIKSVSQSQLEILEWIKQIHLGGKNFDCDLTFGNGKFYTNSQVPEICYDIEPLFPFVENVDSSKTPLKDQSIRSAVFDPPFLTYIKGGRNSGSIMGKRFSGYWSYQELEQHYKSTLLEAYRILSDRGVLVVKCQDIIHNHKMHCTHYNVLRWTEGLFRLRDLFILTSGHRITSSNVIQKHARIYHSYFLVLEKLNGKRIMEREATNTLVSK